MTRDTNTTYWVYRKYEVFTGRDITYVKERRIGGWCVWFGNKTRAGSKSSLKALTAR